MAYNEFAYFYDEFNGEADYDALYEQIRQELNAHDIRDGILADLGCGTGELTLMLTQAGYDMIGIDQSEEMLCVVRDKAEQLGLSGKLLLLQQDLLKLDLYGTIRGAVSTFDTFNHIPDLDTAIANAGFFMEKGGVFLFDMNTPYKHRNVLGDNEFTFEEEDAAGAARALDSAKAAWDAQQTAENAGELLLAAADAMRLAGVDAEEALTFAAKRFTQRLEADET